MSLTKTDEQVLAFLRGLAKLSAETGIKIDGCGCCGSPSLADVEESDAVPFQYAAEKSEHTPCRLRSKDRDPRFDASWLQNDIRSDQ